MLDVYKNPDLPFEERVADLVSRMTLDEKISQMVHHAPAIERLGIPAYNWWNECLHGVGRAGIATVFPQAIGMASTWNVELMTEIAVAIANEGRAKYHQALREGFHGQYHGLTFWTPNINIFRDPRWGRGQETYGECPYLTARLGVAMVKGLQGDDPKYLKTVATPKHYAVHSGPEHDRHHFDVDVPERDLWDTYLPAFKATVQEGQAYSVMSAYQRFRGEPCSSSTLLLQDILRDEWGFEGFVVSDCGAIRDIFENHRVVDTPEEAAARAVIAGCELNCGETYMMLKGALAQNLIDEATIDHAVHQLFLARFKLGMFDPPECVPFAQIPYEVNDCPAHRELALRTARESIILLKNDGLLPLDRTHLKTIAVIGPNADSVDALLGNYSGIPAQPITPLAGIRKKVEPDVDVLYVKGCNIVNKILEIRDRNYNEQFASALTIARRADVVIMVMGLSQALEGENGQMENVGDGQSSQGDRQGLDLPAVQEELLKAIHALGKPVVLVLMNGSPISVNWADEHIPAIVEAWYPGQAGGTALADVLFGDYNPAGRLPITFYKSDAQLPPIADYEMAKGRTYRYFQDEPLYPFGHGLSYTSFTYSDLRMAPRLEIGQPLEVSVRVRNTGQCAGDEVIQLYTRQLEAPVIVPIHQLAGFARIHLQPDEAQTLHFTLKPEQFSFVTEAGQRFVTAGRFSISVGGGQPGHSDCLLSGEVELAGQTLEIAR